MAHAFRSSLNIQVGSAATRRHFRTLGRTLCSLTNIRSKTTLASVRSTRCSAMAPLRDVVLIDMDNTLVNFDLEFGSRWVERRPGDDLTMITRRKNFELETNFSDDLRPLAVEIMSEPGFFIAFQPNPGALDAVREMIAEGLHVFFCTAPLPFQYETCVAEKFAWVRKHFGEEFLPRIIITRDKTIVKGAVLIDDKPKVTGACPNPEWTHILFNQPYNVDVQDRPRMSSWQDWRNVVMPILDLPVQKKVQA